MEKLSGRLELTEDEAFALLSLAMLSNEDLDSTAQNAVAKLAEYCKSKPVSNHKPSEPTVELCGAG